MCHVPAATVLQGSTDAFVAKLDGTLGNPPQYSRFLGDNGADVATDIVLGDMGAVYLIGETGSIDFPTVNAIDDADPSFDGGSRSGKTDAFVARIIEDDGTPIVSDSTYLGGDSDDTGLGIALHDGHVWVAGSTTSSNFPVSSNAFDNEYEGPGKMSKRDPFVADATNSYAPGDNHDPDGDSDGLSITIVQPAALNVAAGVSDQSVTGEILTDQLLGQTVAEAISLWAETGITAQNLRVVHDTNVRVADLDGTLLAGAVPGFVVIDNDAAGYGWITDSTASNDTLFDGVDLLSVLVHEFGHILGFDHDLMGATLGVGVRDLQFLDDVAASSGSWTGIRRSGDVNADGRFDQREEPKSHPFHYVHSESFPAILDSLGVSLLLTTYRAGKLIAVRVVGR